MLVEIDPAFPAFPDISPCLPENEREDPVDEKCREEQPEQRFREDEMAAMRIDQRLTPAAASRLLQALLHASDRPAGVPDHIVLRAGKQQSSLNPLDGDHDLLRQRVLFLREMMKIQTRDPVSAPLGFLPDLILPVKSRNCDTRSSLWFPGCNAEKTAFL